MKKSVILFTALASAMIPFSAFSVSAAENTAKIHMTLTMDEKVLDTDLTVKDTNGDGKLTCEDALYEAHEQFYEGGAAAGYGDGFIWGRHCSGGYTLYNQDERPLDENRPYNDRMEIRDGDVFNWSAQCIDPEMYLFSSDYISLNDTGIIPNGTEIEVMVTHLIPTQRELEKAAGIEILIDGQKTGIKTGADGKAAVKLNKAGYHKITADVSDLTEFNKLTDGYMTFTVAEAERKPAQSAPAVIAAAATTQEAAAETTQAETTQAETTQAESTKAESASASAQTTAEAAVQTAKTTASAVQSNVTKKPANAPAAQSQAAVTPNDGIKTTGEKTGDAMPVAALTMTGLAAAVWGIVVSRKKF